MLSQSQNLRVIMAVQSMMLMFYSRQLGKIGGMNYGNKQRSKN